MRLVWRVFLFGLLQQHPPAQELSPTELTTKYNLTTTAVFSSHLTTPDPPLMTSNETMDTVNPSIPTLPMRPVNEEQVSPALTESSSMATSIFKTISDVFAPETLMSATSTAVPYSTGTKSISTTTEKPEDSVIFELCEKLMESLFAVSCIYSRHHKTELIEVNISNALAVFEEFMKKDAQNVSDSFLSQSPWRTSISPMNRYSESSTLSGNTVAAILASCGVLLGMIIGIAVYVACHHKSYRKNQLTRDLQTAENGYHDNPILEVMEVQSEMQEKQQPPKGDSWIVPTGDLAKGDLPDEEDTHL